MTPEEAAAINAQEATEIEAELRAEHRPELHGGAPCPSGGCCVCQIEGVCDTGIALVLLDTARAEVAALQAAGQEMAEALTWTAANLSARMRGSLLVDAPTPDEALRISRAALDAWDRALAGDARERGGA